MLSLDQVRDEILELMNSCGADPEKAQAGIQEIFYSLMCADQPLYLIYAEESPLISPASSDTKIFICVCSATASLQKSISGAQVHPIKNIPCWTSSR